MTNIGLASIVEFKLPDESGLMMVLENSFNCMDEVTFNLDGKILAFS